MHFPLGLSLKGSSGVVSADHVVEFCFQFLLQFDKSEQLFFDDIVGLLHLCQSQSMFLALLFLLQSFPLAEGECGAQAFLLPLFFLPLQPQRLQFCLEVILFILQFSYLAPQFLNDQLIAVPPFYKAFYFVFFLHQFFIPELYAQASVSVVIADAAIDTLQCLQLILQAFGLVFDDAVVLVDTLSLCEGALYVCFEAFYLFIIEVFGDEVVGSSLNLSRLIFELFHPLAQLQVVLLLLLQSPQLLLKFPHRLLLVVPTASISKPLLRTHFDYSKEWDDNRVLMIG